MPSPVVYGTCGGGFGDLWASLHYLIRRAHQQGRPTHISRRPFGDRDEYHRLVEMLSCINDGFDATGPVLVVDDPPAKQIGLDCWGDGPYYPTRVRWTTNKSRRIAVQFDGVSSAGEKNPDRYEIDTLVNWGNKRGLLFVPVGKELPLRDCIQIMAMCECFLGCCSGMSHLAHSVGIPTYILEYKHAVSWWHGRNTFTVCKGVKSFMDIYDGTP